MTDFFQGGHSLHSLQNKNKYTFLYTRQLGTSWNWLILQEKLRCIRDEHLSFQVSKNEEHLSFETSISVLDLQGEFLVSNAMVKKLSFICVRQDNGKFNAEKFIRYVEVKGQQRVPVDMLEFF